MSVVLNEYPAVKAVSYRVLVHFFVVDKEVTLTETAEVTAAMPCFGIGGLALLPSLQMVGNDSVIVFFCDVLHVTARNGKMTGVKKQLYVGAFGKERFKMGRLLSWSFSGPR